MSGEKKSNTDGEPNTEQEEEEEKLNNEKEIKAAENRNKISTHLCSVYAQYIR